MEVSLIAHTPEPDIMAAAAALLTHENSDFDSLKRRNAEQLKKILRAVIDMGHESVVEHASFTFAISGVSRALTHQLVRHRIASYSQQSQRYIEQDMHYVIPPSIKRQFARRYREIMEEVWQLYDELKQHVPIEDARYVLPNATCSRILVTMNARSLLNFFELRCCLHAQWEIRMLAWKMLKLVREVAPTIFEKAGPPCKT
ncbi:MAG TPA: FAD-dependent thymidylate synthase, partial [Thermoplasmatales archaeon]|nr:FAD-dependent thymidylate synthase [Thermoplasmatales archaeon]